MHVLYVDPGSCELGPVRRCESHHPVGGVLHRAVAAQERIAEVEAYFANDAFAGYDERGDEIVLTVASQLAERYLRTREDDRLRQSLEHERERRGAVGEGVGAVQHDEAVERIVVVCYGISDEIPLLISYIGRIEQRIELEYLPLGDIRRREVAYLL